MVDGGESYGIEIRSLDLDIERPRGREPASLVFAVIQGSRTSNAGDAVIDIVPQATPQLPGKVHGSAGVRLE